MINASDLSGKLAIDANNLSSLKQAAHENSPEAVKKVAGQFEAMFVNMMLKSMRDATPQDSPFDSEQSRSFTAMLDQQLSQNIANRGVGLADVLVRQLTKANIANPSAAMDAATRPATASDNAVDTLSDSNLSASGLIDRASSAIGTAADKLSQLPGKAGEFMQRMAVHAAEASLDSGIPAHFMLGQAALESGWGKHEIKAADGSTSHNLFGIKASGDWKGKVVETTTTEYVNGIKQKRVEKFRAYDSYADSFRDFASLISGNPRYEQAMNNTGNLVQYAQALQKAGYATDPNYASKLVSVVKKVGLV